MVKVLLVEDDEEDYILTRELLREARGDLNLDMAAAETGTADYLVKNNLSSELLERSIRYSLEQKRHEMLLCKAGERLESQVAVRTAELSEANRRLHDEIEGRKLKEQELMARERQLRASEERYRILAEKSSDGIIILQQGSVQVVIACLCIVYLKIGHS